MSEIKKEKLIKCNTVFEGKILSVQSDEVVGITGKPERREVVRHNGGVGVVALDDCANVYLVRQYRYALDDEIIEIPAGKLEKGEGTETCGRRELAEEAGIIARQMRLLTVLLPTVGFCDEKIYIYLATGLTFGVAHPDDGEDVRLIKLPLADAVQRVLDGEINDGKTVAGLLMTKLLTEVK